MESESPLIGPLLEKAEAYSKTSIELVKLKAVETGAHATSGFATGALLLLILSFMVLSASAALALWLGKLWGELSLGFLAVAVFYAFTALFFFLLHKRIKAGINNSMIRYLSEALWKN